jgi:hypothetical protein
MMSQSNRLLDYLKTNGTINPLESWQQLGIYRLSDTVFRLRKQGYLIRTDLVEIKNQFNEVCRVANYVFEVQS